MITLHIPLIGCAEREPPKFNRQGWGLWIAYARPHHGYVFLNRRCDRLKVLVCDGIGIWLAARRLHIGSFSRVSLNENTALSRSQFDALVLGLPWQRMGKHGVIAVV
jgi:hypothetical protein